MMVILEQKVESLGLNFDQVPHLTRWWMQRRAKSVASKMATTGTDEMFDYDI